MIRGGYRLAYRRAVGSAASASRFARSFITSAKSAVYEKHGIASLLVLVSDSVLFRSGGSSHQVPRPAFSGLLPVLCRVIDRPLAELTPNKVLLKILAAPMNPADFNMVRRLVVIRRSLSSRLQIEGVYSIRPELPAIGGNEGVAEVIKVGDQVKDLQVCARYMLAQLSLTVREQVGDWVIPVKPGAGTWRTHAVADPNDVDKIANDIPAEDAATVSVNPCSAWRMLHDFRKLNKGFSLALERRAVVDDDKAVRAQTMW